MIWKVGEIVKVSDKGKTKKTRFFRRRKSFRLSNKYCKKKWKFCYISVKTSYRLVNYKRKTIKTQ